MSETSRNFDHVQIGSIVIRCYEFECMLQFWQSALSYGIGHTDEGFVILKDPFGKGPNVSLDQAPTRRTGKRS